MLLFVQVKCVAEEVGMFYDDDAMIRLSTVTQRYATVHGHVSFLSKQRYCFATFDL